MGKGAASGDTTWNVDGMPITDMSSLSLAVLLRLRHVPGDERRHRRRGREERHGRRADELHAPKSGTNQFHGQWKTYFEGQGMQSMNMPPDLAASVGLEDRSRRRDGTLPGLGRRHRRADPQGPLVVLGRVRRAGHPHHQDGRREGPHGPARTRPSRRRAQITKSMRGSFTFFQAGKYKWGRNAGAFCDQDCSVDQGPVGGPNQMCEGRGQLQRREQPVPRRAATRT